MELCEKLVTQANADLRQMRVEPDPEKRAWLGGRAQVLLSLANFIRENSPSTADLEAKVEMLMSKAAEAVKLAGRMDYAPYDVGKVAGLNLVRRLLRGESPAGVSRD